MAHPEEQLEVRILGPLEVVSGGGTRTALGGQKQRAVLAVLATRAGTTVSTDALIESLWPQSPPATATTTVQVYVSRLRKLIGAETIVSEAGGYRLSVDRDQLDATRFEHLAAMGRELRATGRPEEAAAALAEAISLWRGSALADFAYDSWAQPEISRLEEERLACLEDRFDAELARGAGPELVAELQDLVSTHPLRERLRRQLMLALYRAGRQADALDAYQSFKGLLDRELGLAPSTELKDLERLILQHDAELVAATRPGRTNLPVQPTSLVGRERELREVGELLRSSRLLTLTGAGGSGKTRLALQAAAEAVDEFPDGVWFVPLAVLTDPQLIEPTIAQVVGARDNLGEFLRGKRLLLLLDNLEQLLPDAADAVADLLGAEDAKVLATSRERLALSAEQEYPVPTLPLDQAAELFVQRARQLSPAFEPDEHIDEIARRLDGLPLAIELAAARIKILPPRGLVERLDERLPLLTSRRRDVEERQRTMRATIEWSYDLLSEDEKLLFCRLAVFVDGCTLEAAEEVCGASVDDVQSLVEKSLLGCSDGRYYLLETIREYASEGLIATGEAEAVRHRHAEHYARVAEHSTAVAELVRTDDPILAVEQENMLRAHSYFRTHHHPQELALVVALARRWLITGQVDEGRRATEEVLALHPDGDPRVRCALLANASDFARLSGDTADATLHAEESLTLARQLADPAREAGALHRLASAARLAGDYVRAIDLYELAIRGAEAAGLPVATEMADLADVALGEGDFERALALSSRAVDVAQRESLRTTLVVASFNLASAKLHLGRLDEATHVLRETLQVAEEIGYYEAQAWCVLGAAAISALTGAPDASVRMLRAADTALADRRIALGRSEQRLRSIVMDRLGDGRIKGDDGEPISLEEGVQIARQALD